MNDGKTYIGFGDTFIGQDIVRIAKINRYDLDETTSKLRSPNSIVTFIVTYKIKVNEW